MWINRDMLLGLNRMLIAHVAETEEELYHMSFLHDMRRYAETKGRLDQAWLILSGDWHGRIYLTVPFKLVGPKARIEGLLWTMFNIDHSGGGWGFPEPAHANLVHTDRPDKGEPSWIDGFLLDTLWLCEKFAGKDVLSDMLEMHGEKAISHYEDWAENGIVSTRDELARMNWEQFARKELDLRD